MAGDYRTASEISIINGDVVDSWPVVSNHSGMKSFWRYSGGGIAAFIVIGMLLPERVQIQRETLVAAYPATVFALVNDYRQFNRWSGWMDNDPNARFDISGPPHGVGASLTWDGQIIGSGRLTITDSVPFTTVTNSLDIGADTAVTTSFFLSHSGTDTRVMWSYERDFGLHLAGRYFGLMLDGIVGPEYEADLANLKAYAEDLPRIDFSALEVEQLVVEANQVAYRAARSIPEATALAEALADAYYDILTFIDRQALHEAGAPMSITRSFNGTELAFDAAIPIRGGNDDIGNSQSQGQEVRIGTTYAGPVVRVRHVGSYATLGQTHDKIVAWLAALGIERNGDAWETYLSDPTRTVESELLTDVYYPVEYGDGRQ